MYKIYLKQAIQILKQNKLMSIIAILGTALAIMMVMTIIVTEEIQNISVAPEINRHRTYYMTREMIKDTIANHSWSGNISLNTYNNCLKELQTPEYAVPYILEKGTFSIEGMNSKEEGRMKLTTADFFQVMSLSFVTGRPFTEEEVTSGIKCAVISEGMYRKLAKDTEPLERMLVINKIPFRIIGVVKDVSELFRSASADVWVPYTSLKTNGNVMLMLTLRDNSDYPALYKEIREREKKYNSEHAPSVITISGPANHWITTQNLYYNSEEELKDAIKTANRKKWLVIGILLLVPAINLSGFSFSRMKKRMSEIGVRKAFGAKRHVILLQVLYENLITSLIGGITGLGFSILIVFRMKDWLLEIPADNSIPFNTLVSPIIFLAVFALCIFVNLLSAGVPAWRASRGNITKSIHQNDN